jgi:hypothetical protein
VGRRLDQVLAARVGGLSRRQARVLLDIGGVFVDGRRVKVAGRPMHAGRRCGGDGRRARARDQEDGRAARSADERQLPPFSVVFEDDDIVVVDKPAGPADGADAGERSQQPAGSARAAREAAPRDLRRPPHRPRHQRLVVFAKTAGREPASCRAVSATTTSSGRTSRSWRRISARV